MSSENYLAMCLGAIDYKENDKLITLYAKGKGKITATLRGCKSPKSKLKFASSPMCFGEYELNLTRGRYTVTGIADAEMFSSLWADLDKFYIGMSMIEIFNKFTYENEVYDGLFLEVLRGLNALNNGEGANESIFAYFLFNITKQAGYEPYLDGCIKCGDENIAGKKFSLRDGGLVCNDCGNGITLNDEVLSILKDLENATFEDFVVNNYNNKSLLNVIFVFSKYLEHILGEKVKSLCQFLDNIYQNT